jgi:hypothetical protein
MFHTSNYLKNGPHKTQSEFGVKFGVKSCVKFGVKSGVKFGVKSGVKYVVKCSFHLYILIVFLTYL